MYICLFFKMWYLIYSLLQMEVLCNLVCVYIIATTTMSPSHTSFIRQETKHNLLPIEIAEMPGRSWQFCLCVYVCSFGRSAVCF